ncbi:unnamed protein product [Mycena citricolor]|nr:unnamed protein product [Mycena citricolor]
MPYALSQLFWRRNAGESSPQVMLHTDAPVFRLPAELLGVIFLFALIDEWEPMTEFDDAAFPVEPVVLSHVCRLWRDVALAHSALWSTLWIDRPRKAHLPMVQLWLERSASCSLSISLRQTDYAQTFSNPTQEEHDLTDQILLLLLGHTHRWYSLRLSFTTSAQQALASFSTGDASMVQHVSLETDRWDCQSADAFHSALYSCPSLRRLNLPSSAKNEHIPWSQLTHIESAPEWTLDTCLSILSSCSTLQSASLTCSADPDWPSVSFSECVSLPRLVSLSITGSRTDLASLFDRLTLPNLASLSLEYRHVPHLDRDPHSLHDLLARSHCNLTAFSLHEKARAMDTQRHLRFIATCAPQMIGLLSLELQVDVGDALARCSTATDREHESPMFPGLKSLSLVGLRRKQVAQGNLVDTRHSQRPAMYSVDSLAGPCD